MAMHDNLFRKSPLTIRSLSAVALACVLAACTTMAPHYERPAAPVAAAFPYAAASAAASPTGAAPAAAPSAAAASAAAPSTGIAPAAQPWQDYFKDARLDQ